MSGRIEPQPIGRFFDVDSRGFIVPEVSREKIKSPWLEAVTFVSERLIQAGPSSEFPVTSVFVRGSAPRGFAIEGVSDLDFIYLAEAKVDERAIETAVVAKFPFVRELELLQLDQASMNKVFLYQTRPYFQMLLKTQSLCVAGRDVNDGTRPFKLDGNLVSHAFNLAKEFSHLPQWLEEDRVKSRETETRRWFSRRLVRSGLEITLKKPGGKYTRDLYFCVERFADCYPAYAAEMRRVLLNCLNGHEDPLAYASLVELVAAESVNLRECSSTK